MYWVTKSPCPQCSLIFSYFNGEIDLIKKILKQELKGEPSNGWPRDFCKWDIGLVKVYDNKNYYLKCFGCDLYILDKEYEECKKALPKKSVYEWHHNRFMGVRPPLKPKSKPEQKPKTIEEFDLEETINSK